MKEVFQSPDPAAVAFAKALLDGAGIPYFVFDEYTSALFIGASGCTARIMVLDEDLDDALDLLEDAGLEEEW